MSHIQETLLDASKLMQAVINTKSSIGDYKEASDIHAKLDEDFSLLMQLKHCLLEIPAMAARIEEAGKKFVVKMEEVINLTPKT